MKYAHHNETNGKLLGWYDSEIHETIPTPNIEVNETDWQIAINKNYNYVDASTSTLSFKDFSTFEQLQARKLNELEVSYNTANQKDIAYMDAVFQADNKSQDTIAKVLSVGVVPDDFYWNDKANNKVSMVYTDLQGLAVEILSRNQISFDKLQTLKAQVNSATTQAELDAIAW